MATNKIYEVERIESNTKFTDTIYSGRIRDCKKSLKNIEEAYKERGFMVHNTGFTLFIYSNNGEYVNWVYAIQEKKGK